MNDPAPTTNDSHDERNADMLEALRLATQIITIQLLDRHFVHDLSHVISEIHYEIDGALSKKSVHENRVLLEILQRIEIRLATAQDMIREHLSLEPVRPTAEASICDAQNVIHETAGIWAGYLMSSRCQLKLQMSARRTRVRLSREDLKQILSVLIVNSVEALARTISVSVTDSDLLDMSDICVLRPGLEILVADDGIGLPSHDRDDLFRPGYTSKPDRSGLGLFLARALARRAGGDLVVVEPNLQRGAVFRAGLPCASRDR